MVLISAFLPLSFVTPLYSAHPLCLPPLGLQPPTMGYDAPIIRLGSLTLGCVSVLYYSFGILKVRVS